MLRFFCAAKDEIGYKEWICGVVLSAFTRYNFYTERYTLDRKKEK